MPSVDEPIVPLDGLEGEGLVQCLREMGYRVSLREDRFSIEFTPGLMAMPMHIFNVITSQVDAIRDELREEKRWRQ